MIVNLGPPTGMKKSITLTCLSALLIIHSAFAAGTYVIDKAHSSMGFQVRHLFSTVPGKFDNCTGTITYDEASPEQSSVEVNIKTASVDTGVKMRDDDLRSPNFFDAAKYPDLKGQWLRARGPAGVTGQGRRRLLEPGGRALARASQGVRRLHRDRGRVQPRTDGSAQERVRHGVHRVDQEADRFRRLRRSGRRARGGAAPDGRRRAPDGARHARGSHRAGAIPWSDDARQGAR